jgi:hypothetical protein
MVQPPRQWYDPAIAQAAICRLETHDPAKHRGAWEWVAVEFRTCAAMVHGPTLNDWLTNCFPLSESRTERAMCGILSHRPITC